MTVQVYPETLKYNTNYHYTVHTYSLLSKPDSITGKTKFKAQTTWALPVSTGERRVSHEGLNVWAFLDFVDPETLRHGSGKTIF